MSARLRLARDARSDSPSQERPGAILSRRGVRRDRRRHADRRLRRTELAARHRLDSVAARRRGAVRWSGPSALLALTNVIVVPVIAAGVIAAVAAPLVALAGAPPRARPVGAILLLVAAIAARRTGRVHGAGRDHEPERRPGLAPRRCQEHDRGLAQGPRGRPGQGEGRQAGRQLVLELRRSVRSWAGSRAGLKELSSLVFFLAMTTLSLIFLLADGPKIRAWGERHMGVPAPVARTISSRTLESLRGYFLGVTLVAAFNALVVGVGALVLGVPQAGTIAVVTLLAAYVPYLGAWTAGAFSVLVALGGAGNGRRRRHDRRPAARQQRAAAAGPAARHGRGARHPPARRPDRHDRGRRALRRRRPDPRRADDGSRARASRRTWRAPGRRRIRRRSGPRPPAAGPAPETA